MNKEVLRKEVEGAMAEEVEGQVEQPVDEVKAGEDVVREEESFPASYVRELRAENARRRANERKLEEMLKAVATTVGLKEGAWEGVTEKVKVAMEASSESRALAEEALVESRFRELIRERGVIDADAAGRLLDMSGVKVDLEARKVEGLEEAMESLLVARPYLAGGGVPSGTPGGGTPRARRETEEETLSGRVRKAFAKRLPSGMSVPGNSVGNMRIR